MSKKYSKYKKNSFTKYASGGAINKTNITDPLSIESTATTGISSIVNRNLTNKNYNFSNDQQAIQYYQDQNKIARNEFGVQTATGIAASIANPALIPFELAKIGASGYNWWQTNKDSKSGISGVQQARNYSGYTNYNDPLTGLPYAKYGMNIGNAKIEKEEVIYDKGTPSQVLNKPSNQTSSVTQEVNTGTHESGNDATVQGGSNAYVFSDTLKNPITNKTFAEDASLLGNIRGLFESKISQIQAKANSSKSRTKGDGKDLFSQGTQKMYSNRIKSIQQNNILPIDNKLDELVELNENEKMEKETSNNMKKGGYMKYMTDGGIIPTHKLSDNDPYEYSNTNNKWYTRKKGTNDWIDLSNNPQALSGLKNATPLNFYPPVITDDGSGVQISPNNEPNTVTTLPSKRPATITSIPTNIDVPEITPNYAKVQTKGFKYNPTDILGGVSILSNTIGTLAQRRPANMGMLQAPKYSIPTDNVIQKAQYDYNKSYNTGIQSLRNLSPNSSLFMSGLQGLYGQNINALSGLRNTLSERQITARDANYNANIETINKNTGINYENQNNQRGFDNTRLTQLNQGVQRGVELANQKDLARVRNTGQLDQLNLILGTLNPSVKASIEKELEKLESYKEAKYKNGGYISKYKRK